MSEKIHTKRTNEFITLDKTYYNDIILNLYTLNSINGTYVILDKKQAKQLVNDLQEFIYESEE
jgi:hypothetical protein